MPRNYEEFNLEDRKNPYRTILDRFIIDGWSRTYLEKKPQSFVILQVRHSIDGQTDRKKQLQQSEADDI